MFYSIRSKLIASFLGVTLLVGAVSLFIGGQLLYKSVLDEARVRVRLDLNAASEIYLTRVNSVKIALNITTLGFGFLSALRQQNAPELVNRLRRVAQQAELDFAGVVSKEGRTFCRIGPDSIPETETQPENPIANLALRQRIPVAGTVVLRAGFLYAENPKLANQARVRVLQTPGANPTAAKEETSGMAIAVAIPIFDNSVLLGVLYGGVLLNRNQTIVATVEDTVFLQEIYKGRNIGRASVFFKDLRISTNVFTENETRAIGTRVSEDVREHVLEKGERWTERAFVVNDWYITSYKPIEDVFGNRVGMLGVGVLEKKYTDIRWKALSVFVIITAAGMVFAIWLGYVLADRIMRPVKRLIKASLEVSDGNLWPDIGPISKDELSVLQNTFRHMIVSLGERDRRRSVESENRLLQSEKQASVGRLAAGVAHEINNPLTGVLTYTHLLLRRKDIGADVRSDLEAIAKSTERVREIVRSLLDFSRQTNLYPEPTNVNRLIRSAISLMENQALVRGISVEFKPAETLPALTLDRSQFQSVLLNILINALDATEPGGHVVVSTDVNVSVDDAGRGGVEIGIADTGCGIPPEDLNKLFDPFFSTKEVGHGTGLGLAVSLGIVQRHGGTIRVQSEAGKGSCFIIWLPIEGQAE